jgi:hypothetical protein
VLRFKAADMEDVHTVFADLSPISGAEVIKDCGTWWRALPKVFKLLELPDSQTEALVDEIGMAVALFGHYPGQRSGIRTTWFVFSNEFIARGVAATLACQRRLKGLQLVYPDTVFHSYTVSDHPTRDRWFSLLGFCYLGLMSDDSHAYILPKPDKPDDLEPVGWYNPTHPRAS